MAFLLEKTNCLGNIIQDPNKHMNVPIRRTVQKNAIFCQGFRAISLLLNEPRCNETVDVLRNHLDTFGTF